MGEILNGRRASSEKRLDGLKANLSETAKLVSNKASVYVTGSFGRGEASQHSDLDVFIVAMNGGPENAKGENRGALSRLDEICIKADLIRAARRDQFQDFSGDGEYLMHYTVSHLVKKLGTSEDDAENTFTARLLLLLESQSLIGDEVHVSALSQVIKSYWRDFSGRETNFKPTFLANDILRLWRTFCVNYEARTQSEPALKKAKRKLKNYKLKHSRLLTCYSALLYLSAIFDGSGTVSEVDALRMTQLTPTRRLEALSELTSAAIPSQIDLILNCYEKFLKETDASEPDLVARFMDRDRVAAYGQDAKALGDAVHQALHQIGERTGFYRMLVV